MAGLPVRVNIDGHDIPADGGPQGVIFAPTTFSMSINAIPANFELHIRDPHKDFTFFKTGKEVKVFLGATAVYGGYLTQIVRTHHFPDKVSPTWILRGADYNMIFDKRVLRNPPATDPQHDPNSYFHVIPSKTPYAGHTPDGQVIRDMLQYYSDMSDWVPFVDDVSQITDPESPIDPDLGSIDPTLADWEFMEQGTMIRQQLDDIASLSGAFFYAVPSLDGATKEIHYHAFESFVSPYGFHETPDGVNTFPFHDVEITEQGDNFVNDALIWGGSEWAGPPTGPHGGGTIFRRVQDPASQAEHGRWQRGETHLGDMATPQQVLARADVLVFGAPGAVGGNPDRGLRYPQWMVTLSWDSVRMPHILRPGSMVPITIPSLDFDMILPLQQIDIGFPELDPDGNAYLRFTGTFSLQATDPYTIWAFLMKVQWRRVRPYLGASPPGSDRPVFGGYATSIGGGLAAKNITHVSGSTYKTPFGYINGTLNVFYAGKLLTPYEGGDGDVEEIDNIHGTFELHETTETLTLSQLVASYRTLLS